MPIDPVLAIAPCNVSTANLAQRRPSLRRPTVKLLSYLCRVKGHDLLRAALLLKQLSMEHTTCLIIRHLVPSLSFNSQLLENLVAKSRRKLESKV